jgi:hypothetical protein
MISSWEAYAWDRKTVVRMSKVQRSQDLMLSRLIKNEIGLPNSCFYMMYLYVGNAVYIQISRSVSVQYE